MDRVIAVPERLRVQSGDDDNCLRVELTDINEIEISGNITLETDDVDDFLEVFNSTLRSVSEGK